MNTTAVHSPTFYHIPALAAETLAYLQVEPNGVYVDATFGGGGHSRLILEALGENGKLIGFDQDPDAGSNRLDDPRFVWVNVNFATLKNSLSHLGIHAIDGLIADLGVSFHHFDTAVRGFSFRFTDAPLDMRMDRRQTFTAADIVNTWEAYQLIQIFRNYGELPYPHKWAAEIIAARKNRPIQTVGQLLQAVQRCLSPKTDYLPQLFQALRMEVNQETEVLESLLQACAEVVVPGGRVVFISYHSIEDRIVKHYLNAGNAWGEVPKDFYGNSLSPWRLLTRKPITPTIIEVQQNPRSRSARLRCAIRTDVPAMPLNQNANKTYAN